MSQSTLFSSFDISQQDFWENGSDALIYILVQSPLSKHRLSSAPDDTHKSGISGS